MTTRHKFQLGRVSTLILPFITSIILLIHNTLVLFDYDTILAHIVSINPILILYFYINNYIYNLCAHHRMFIHYLLITYLLCVYDVYIGIPITDIELLVTHYLLFGVTVVLYGILKFRENKNGHKK